MERLIVTACACGLLASCASHQRIRLEPSKAALPTAGATITVVDLRGKEEREFQFAGRPHCFRSYGDDFIAPSKTTYLKQVLQTRSPPDAAQIQLTISRFETVEYCDGSVARTRPLGLAAVTAGVTHGQVALPFDAPKEVKGDTFVLHLAGTINGRPFDVSEQFDYEDIKFVNFPEENPDYIKRIEQAINMAVDQLLKTDAGGAAAR